MLRNQFYQSNVSKPIEFDRIQPKVLRKLGDVIAGPLCQQSWESRDVSADRHLDNYIPIHKKGTKVNLGNYRHVSLTLVLAEILEREIIPALLKDT